MAESRRPSFFFTLIKKNIQHQMSNPAENTVGSWIPYSDPGANQNWDYVNNGLQGEPCVYFDTAIPKTNKHSLIFEMNGTSVTGSYQLNGFSGSINGSSSSAESESGKGGGGCVGGGSGGKGGGIQNRKGVGSTSWVGKATGDLVADVQGHMMPNRILKVCWTFENKTYCTYWCEGVLSRGCCVIV